METCSPQVKQHKRALVAGSVGNFIEWYEFAIYGFLATLIAQNFFQLQGESASSGLILTWASFAVAFFFRPLGALVFGRIGDRIGRKPTLIMVLVFMTLATTAIGLVPTYATWGIAAPLILTGLRILQGLFAGGEYGGAVSLMTEFAPRGKRGLYGAWQSLTVALGLLAGGAVVVYAQPTSHAGLGLADSVYPGVSAGHGGALAAAGNGRNARLCPSATAAEGGQSRTAPDGENPSAGRGARDAVVSGGLHLSGHYASLPSVRPAHRTAPGAGDRRDFQSGVCLDHYSGGDAQ